MPPFCAYEGGQPKLDAPSWCRQEWSFVQRDKCASADPKLSTYFAADYELYYSYLFCGSQDSFTSSALTSAVQSRCTEMRGRWNEPMLPSDDLVWSVDLPVFEVDGNADRLQRRIRFEAHRDALVYCMRFLVPLFFMVIMSWTGFFISHHYLMPRFASSFLSFLALQTFSDRLTSTMGANLAQVIAKL